MMGTCIARDNMLFFLCFLLVAGTGGLCGLVAATLRAYQMPFWALESWRTSEIYVLCYYVLAPPMTTPVPGAAWIATLLPGGTLLCFMQRTLPGPGHNAALSAV
jgi:hypothetical protein